MFLVYIVLLTVAQQTPCADEVVFPAQVSEQATPEKQVSVAAKRSRAGAAGRQIGLSAAEDAAASPRPSGLPPYPPSPVIAATEWAPSETIVRRAKGSDNFPLTWSNDDALYATFGDGFGFQPFVAEKLSLGLVRITGTPDNFHGVNLQSPSIEQRGAGQRQKGMGVAFGARRVVPVAGPRRPKGRPVPIGLVERPRHNVVVCGLAV